MEIGKACGDRCAGETNQDASRCPGTEGRGLQQSHCLLGRDSPGRGTKRCQMWRKPPGSFTLKQANTVSIVLQHMLPVKGEKCRHQHMPGVFQAYPTSLSLSLTCTLTHTHLHTHTHARAHSVVQTCHHTASQGWLKCRAA